MALEDDILAALTREPGLKGREIASRLGLDKGVVNSTLYKLRLRKLAWQDSGYHWFLKSASRESGQTIQLQLDTPLTKLSRYYLHCLSLDDESGVSLFAQSRFSPEYIELPALPEFDPEERSLASFAGVLELFQRLRTSASRQVPYLGYPVRLRAHRSEKGWEGFFVEPVFLFDFTDDALQRCAEPTLTGELPTFNFRVLKSLAMGDDSQIMDEAARLAEELGFSEAEPPEVDEFMARLTEIREDWDWKEQMNPACLSSGTPLAQITEAGIYNRAIVFGCERSPYTKGLEQELAELQRKTEEACRPTALGAWLRQDFTSFRAPAAQEPQLLEPLPLNSEQRGFESTTVRHLTAADVENFRPEQMESLYDFFTERAEYWKMAPHLELVASQNVLLALPGKEYVAYFPRGGTNYVKFVPGSYQMEWLHPETGRCFQKRRIALVDGNRDFVPPERPNDDWVLHLVKIL